MNETDVCDTAEQLCLLVGMIMEDVSLMALCPPGSATFPSRIEVLQQAGRDIVALSNAAAVINRRWPTSPAVAGIEQPDR